MSSKKSRHLHKPSSTPTNEPTPHILVEAPEAKVPAPPAPSDATVKNVTMVDFQKKAFEFTNQNIEQAFDFTRKLLAVSEFSQAVSLQQSFASERAQSLKSQAHAVNEIALRVSTEATKPLTDGIEKTFETLSKSFAA